MKVTIKRCSYKLHLEKGIKGFLPWGELVARTRADFLIKQVFLSISHLTLIAGGNHAQFGYLGKLFSDDAPEINLQEQQRLTLEALIRHFEYIEKEL